MTMETGMFLRSAFSRTVMAVGTFMLMTSAALAADATAGKAVFKRCAACHTTDAKNRVGPGLEGILGRPVGAADGFRYSKAMLEFSEDGKVWNEQLLGEFLASPKGLVKGTSMAFPGLKKPEEIANLITFLKDPSATD